MKEIFTQHNHNAPDDAIYRYNPENKDIECEFSTPLTHPQTGLQIHMLSCNPTSPLALVYGSYNNQDIFMCVDVQKQRPIDYPLPEGIEDMLDPLLSRFNIMYQMRFEGQEYKFAPTSPPLSPAPLVERE